LSGIAIKTIVIGGEALTISDNLIVPENYIRREKRAIFTAADERLFGYERRGRRPGTTFIGEITRPRFVLYF